VTNQPELAASIMATVIAETPPPLPWEALERLQGFITGALTAAPTLAALWPLVESGGSMVNFMAQLNPHTRHTTLELPPEDPVGWLLGALWQGAASPLIRPGCPTMRMVCECSYRVGRFGPGLRNAHLDLSKHVAKHGAGVYACKCGTLFAVRVGLLEAWWVTLARQGDTQVQARRVGTAPRALCR